MSQTQKVGKQDTSVFGTHKDGVVTYYSIPVVVWSEDEITLDTGGWRTPTTRARMNQTSNQFGLGFKVYQKNYRWFVDHHGKTFPFSAGVVRLSRDGQVVGESGFYHTTQTAKKADKVYHKTSRGKVLFLKRKVHHNHPMGSFIRHNGCCLPVTNTANLGYWFRSTQWVTNETVRQFQPFAPGDKK